MSKRATEDVMDFINSLPETPAKGPRKDEDFMEFLDELSAHEKKPKGKFEPRRLDRARPKPQTPQTTALAGPATPGSVASDGETAGDKPAEKASEKAGDKTSETTPLGAQAQEPAAAAESAAAEAPDPIASLTSWWSSEGSQKVTLLWGQLTSNAQQIGETTYQLASSTTQQLLQQRQRYLAEHGAGANAEQILAISDKLNSVLGSMAQQITDGLMDPADELLNVLLVHDAANAQAWEALCCRQFDTVMGQVEGGIRTTVSSFNHKHGQDRERRHSHIDLGMFHGKPIDGEKLCRANLDSSVKDYLKLKLLDSEHAPAPAAAHAVNKLDVFIAVQAVSLAPPPEKPDAESLAPAPGLGTFTFTVLLRDITNNITLSTHSQPFPVRWALWVAGLHEDVDAAFGPDSDAMDPAEWVRGWLDDGLALTFAVLAQEYVTRRMGIA